MFKFSKRSSKKLQMIENKIQYESITENGLIIGDKYIPAEVVSNILYFVDPSTLLLCQLVCKQWHYIIQKIVWYKKAQSALKTIPIDRNLKWPVYYYMSAKIPFDKNLIKNHSGQLGENYWTLGLLDRQWTVQCPPSNAADLPDDPVFEGKKHCFVNGISTDYFSRYNSSIRGKYQTIDLVNEGFSTYLLDRIQPKIKMSEWYCGLPDQPTTYASTFQLIAEKKGNKQKIIDHRQMTRVLRSGERNEWFKNEFEFTNYGKGLRKIRFIHSGQHKELLSYYHGIKVAGACVIVENPFTKRSSNST